jgi:hypothetical protein
MREVRRERAALEFIKQNYGVEKENIVVKSSWGPYTSTQGTAKSTGLPGMTQNVFEGKKVLSPGNV